jgi:hypothetical protein
MTQMRGSMNTSKGVKLLVTRVTFGNEYMDSSCAGTPARAGWNLIE